jgi:hypothetical protein
MSIQNLNLSDRLASNTANSNVILTIPIEPPLRQQQQPSLTNFQRNLAQMPRLMLNKNPNLANSDSTSSNTAALSSASATAAGSIMSPEIFNNINHLERFIQRKKHFELVEKNEKFTIELNFKYFILNDYVFMEPLSTESNNNNSNGSTSNQSESNNPAFNMKINRFYYYKKFDEKDYQKKLRPYLIMEGVSKNVYRYAQVLIASSTQSHSLSEENGQRMIYVLFEPHYGDLHSFMKEKKRLNESEAKHLFRQIVEIVSLCHENRIVIHDIKLKKFVFINEQKTKLAISNLEDCLVLDEHADNDLIRSQQGKI